MNIKDQFLSYNVYLVDYDDTKVQTYANEWFEAPGIIKVSGNAFPGPSSSYSIGTFVSDNDAWLSESIDAQPSINGNEALHTASVYTSNYIGDVIIQGTLDNQVADSTSWVDITTLTFTGSETEPVPVNFNGVPIGVRNGGNLLVRKRAIKTSCKKYNTKRIWSHYSYCCYR